MFETIAASAIFGGIKKHVMGLFKQPLFYVALALLAVGTGTYFYLNHATNQAVKSAVAGADANATIQTYRTKDQAEAALVPIQEKEQAKAAQTQKDYTNVRTVIVTAQAPQRNAQVPRLVIDTLNNLERVSRERRSNESAVPNPDVHAK
jgi:anionic cell wall polymer biosynthesis LytR-Cps2A-Psr (LCP) family protein